MSLWWVQKNQLDPTQIGLIENLPLRETFLVLGPPGSGKTNILIRRAQFVRSQGMPNVLVLTFTRPLTEFIKTGCFDAQGREIFPQTCVTTLESWQRSLYHLHDRDLPRPAASMSLTDWKRELALGARVWPLRSDSLYMMRCSLMRRRIFYPKKCLSSKNGALYSFLLQTIANGYMRTNKVWNSSRM